MLNQITGFNKHLTKVEIETRKMRPRNDDWIVNDPVVVFIPCPSITNFFGGIMNMRWGILGTDNQQDDEQKIVHERCSEK